MHLRPEEVLAHRAHARMSVCADLIYFILLAFIVAGLIERLGYAYLRLRKHMSAVGWRTLSSMTLDVGIRETSPFPSLSVRQVAIEHPPIRQRISELMLQKLLRHWNRARCSPVPRWSRCRFGW